MGQQEDNIYPPGTTVFAKLKGYPWWPAKIEDELQVPAKVMKQKPKTKSPIWTVFFFGSRDYGFFGPDSIRPFNNAHVEKDLKAKKFKTKDLEMAVREALDPSLMDKEDEEEEETKKQPKPKKVSKKTKAKKEDTPNNKRGVDDDDNGDKKKRRKSMSIEQEDQPSNGTDRPSASPVTPRKSEEGFNKANEPLEITRDFKRLYHLRHRLQKLMYEKKQGDIPLEDYPKISTALKEVEEAPMTYDLLRHTKIGKVVKCGTAYEFENDAEYNIHDRCQQLMRKWKEAFLDTKEQGNKGNDTTASDGNNKESTSTLQQQEQE